jgi:parvulin-like peptidyl-prolyl isomerase
LTVSDVEVDQWIANIQNQQNLSEDEFKAALGEKGIRWGDYRRYVKDNLLKFRIVQYKIANKVKVTDEELVTAYRDEFKEDPGAGMKTVELSHIFLPIDPDASPAKVAEVAELAAATYRRVKGGGPTFAEVAKEVSAGPTASDGGFLGTYRAGELGPEIDTAVFAAEAATVTTPIRVSKGLHIFRIHDVRLERNPRVERRLGKLRVSLRERELEKHLRFWVDALRNKAYVRVLL